MKFMQCRFRGRPGRTLHRPCPKGDPRQSGFCWRHVPRQGQNHLGFGRGTRHLSGSSSTRMMSEPMRRMQFQGMTSSLAGPQKQKQKLPGPGTTIAVIHPLSQSNSTSTGQPKVRQVQILITSFCFKSEIRKTHRTCLFCYILCVFSLVLFKVK